MNLVQRICTCGKKLPFVNGMTCGWYCCDEYYCSQQCLDKSFKGTGTNWSEHFTSEGDCYYTEWEAEEEE